MHTGDVPYFQSRMQQLDVLSVTSLWGTMHMNASLIKCIDPSHFTVNKREPYAVIHNASCVLEAVSTMQPWASVRILLDIVRFVMYDDTTVLFYISPPDIFSTTSSCRFMCPL